MDIESGLLIWRCSCAATFIDIHADMTTPWLWLVTGLLLCLAEVFFPTAFMEMALGVSALLVALVALVVPNFVVQAVLWLVLSTGLVWLSRPFVRRRSRPILMDAVEAQTLTAIPPGRTGRVLYEGNSWPARCEDHLLEIPVDEKVYVVGREGTTLVVLPERLIHSRS